MDRDQTEPDKEREKGANVFVETALTMTQTQLRRPRRPDRL